MTERIGADPAMTHPATIHPAMTEQPPYDDPIMACGCGPNQCSDFDDDREGVDDKDLARFGGDDVACPSCGVGVYHDAPQCHKCGHSMMRDDHDQKRPLVPIVAGVLLAALVAIVVLRVF